jgi:Ca-activated chloride channel family protein
MSFIWPVMLLTLLLIPALVWLYFYIQTQRRRSAGRFARLELVQSSKNPPLGARRHIPAAIFIAGLSILLLALARPQTVVSLPRMDGTVILAFDVSGSMAADDLKPTRMEAAKTAAIDFLDRQPLSVQVGVVAFSDNGFSIQPPSSDHEAITGAINRLVPERGTSLANGIFASLNSIAAAQSVEPARFYSNITPQPTPTPTPVPIGTYTPAAILLLTDGENNEMPDPLLAAQASADRGVRIYTIGIGSPEGANLKVEGFTINTRLNEELLKQISSITGGEYYYAVNEQDLLAIYDNLNPQLVVKPEKTEVTSIFAGIGILFFLFGGAFSLLWFSRLP